MPIFKNPSEAAYLGGKKHFTDVIKNSGHANAIIWRQPEEDFNTNSILGKSNIELVNNIIKNIVKKMFVLLKKTLSLIFLMRKII